MLTTANYTNGFLIHTTELNLLTFSEQVVQEQLLFSARLAYRDTVDFVHFIVTIEAIIH